MSADRSSIPPGADADEVIETIQSLQDRVEALEATVEEQDEQIEDLELEKQSLHFALEDLLTGVLGPEINGEDYLLTELSRAAVDEVEEYFEKVAALKDDLESEQQTRSQSDANLRRQLGIVAKAMDADLDEIAMQAMEMDKLARVAEFGADDLSANPPTCLERAEVLLNNLGDRGQGWGEKKSDRNEPRVEILAPEARDKIGAARYESIDSKQTQRVFEKIEDLAADSPRTVRVEKNREGTRYLAVQFGGDDSC